MFKCLPIFMIVCCTAYTPTVEECGKDDGITASGVKAIQGRTVAADHLPFGTEIIIDGHVYTVEDRFGGGYTDKVDIYMDSKNDAFNFGKQWKIVEVKYDSSKSKKSNQTGFYIKF